MFSRRINCPECYGEGTVYWAIDRHTSAKEQVTHAQYRVLPFTEDSARARGRRLYRCEECECEYCGGTGFIDGDYPEVYF